MTTRILISSGTKWEAIVGYSRAVRVGNTIEVAGTTSVDVDGHVIGLGDPYLQTKFILSKIEKALHEAGATMAQVVRTRIFLVDMSHWQAVWRAHGEFFSTIKPASSMLEVKGLISPELLVEIEATAIL